jgi:hypothetical protein
MIPSFQRSQINANWHPHQAGPLHVEICTKRLLIRSIRKEDLENCAKLFGNDKLMSLFSIKDMRWKALQQLRMIISAKQFNRAMEEPLHG